MTIKITQVQTSKGEVVLTVAYDNPVGSGQTFMFALRKADLASRLVTVRALLGRSLTLTDAKEVVVAITNEVRRGKSGIPEDFDFTPYIGVELE